MLGNLHVAFGGRLLRATSVVDPTRLVPRSSRGGATKYIKDLQLIVVSPFCLYPPAPVVAPVVIKPHNVELPLNRHPVPYSSFTQRLLM